MMFSMIEFRVLQEVTQSLRTHKARTALAVLTVAWGVFMLVLLLGGGRGLQNGVELEFRDDAVNSVRVYGGTTTIAHEGHPRGRRIRFDNAAFDSLKRNVDALDRSSGRYYPGDLPVRHGSEQAAYDIRAVHPEHVYLEKTRIAEGRFINEIDIRDKRKVAAIGAIVAERLFGGDNAVGRDILLGEIYYRVVGVFRDSGGRSDEELIYLPISTAQLLYGGGDRVHQLLYTVGDVSYEESTASVEQTRQLLADRYDFSVDDHRAVRIYNNLDEYKKITDLFFWVRVFVAVVGVGTIFTGILAVSNIMMISVAERRVEIGIRKALGATPASITRLVVIESLLITSVAGYLGLLASIGLLELLKSVVPENEYLYQPDVNTALVVSVTLLIIVAGTVSGYLPARKAAAISPVEALAK
jgi:putative ABC transport system permease protein